MKRIFSWLLCAAACSAAGLLLTHCNREKDLVLPHTWRVFPMDSGQQAIFYVIDTTYNTSGAVADKYFRKNTLAGIETDLLNRKLRRVETLRSPDSVGNAYVWEPYRVWNQYKSDQYAESTQENVRKIVLQFPVYPNVSWNGNLYNDLGSQVFKYISVDSTLTVGNRTYEHCVVVQRGETQKGPLTVFQSYAAYAPDLGLVMQYELKKVYDKPTADRFNADKSYVHYEYRVE